MYSNINDPELQLMDLEGFIFSVIADLTDGSVRIEAQSVARCPMEIFLMGDFFVAGKDVLEGIFNERCVHALRNNSRFDHETGSEISEMVSNSKVMRKCSLSPAGIILELAKRYSRTLIFRSLVISLFSFQFLEK